MRLKGSIWFRLGLKTCTHKSETRILLGHSPDAYAGAGAMSDKGWKYLLAGLCAEAHGCQHGHNLLSVRRRG